MKREILFRGKRVDNGEWVEGDLHQKIRVSEKTFDCAIYTNLGLIYEVIPETVGQFTGLTDKNGTKIFEGDIISGGMIMCNQGYSIKNDKSTVSFIDGMFKCGSLSLITFARKCEVVGNIHDKTD